MLHSGKQNRGVFVCVEVGGAQKKERMKETGWGVGSEHCVVKAFESGASICHLLSRFYENERNKKLNLAQVRQLNQASVS